MATVSRRRALKTSFMEVHSFQGKNDPKRHYILFRGRIGKADHFEAFVATELKDACIDILGQDESPQARKVNSKDWVKKVWDLVS